MLDKKSEIYRCGKELFRSKGFKETNVAEIMKMAGMATGTFYNYYPSKEKLFIEIYNEENVKLKKSITESIDLQANPIVVIQEMMSRNLEGMNANPILREWYNREVFSKIENSFREEDGLKSVDFLFNSFIDIVKSWQSDGKMRSDIDAEMIMAIFSSLVVIETHKDEIGIQYFPQLIEYLANFTMNSLLTHPDKGSLLQVQAGENSNE
ncbi:MAG: TetR/AcrR family transcriptional regulator [Clostridium sp.]|uniref:TetR/AcrR family transcriptional regulator n=1 Tax=Clostridium sp. TaxID=1506 RepID=UPI00290F63F4|nr:TetR/AcrR family transcriptional regulator [Clostridium sp.]MDU7339076.1 TetR/AcrR family transcriptional regulator [Clostridium sp.]